MEIRWLKGWPQLDREAYLIIPSPMFFTAEPINQKTISKKEKSPCGRLTSSQTRGKRVPRVTASHHMGDTDTDNDSVTPHPISPDSVGNQQTDSTRDLSILFPLLDSVYAMKTPL